MMDSPLRALRADALLQDVTFAFDCGATRGAHRCVLALHSPVFRRLFDPSNPMCAGATVTVNGLEVKNEGWTWKKAPADADEVDALRGFVIERGETAEYVFDTPGTYELP